MNCLNRLMSAFLVLAFLTVLVHTAPPGCELRTPDLRTLHQCGGRGVVMSCNGTGRTGVPRFTSNASRPVCVLDLSHNRIHSVHDGAFLNVTEVRYLYLSVNNISRIYPGAFQGMRHLRYLNLSGNNLAWPQSFGEGLFKPLTNLTVINLKGNPNIQTFEGLDEELLPMKNLEGIFIEGCDNCSFGQGFANFSHLRNVSLSSRTDGGCQMPNITNATFQHLPPTLYGLWMSACSIKTIEKGAFANLEQLRILDISYNPDLTFEGMNLALFGLRNHKHLYSLNVNQIHNSYGRGTELNEKNIENLKTLRNLTRLTMDLNKIEIMDVKILSPVYQLPKTLRLLTLSGNRLTYDEYITKLYSATNITYLDISRQHLSYDPFRNSHFDPSQYHDSIRTLLSNQPEMPGVSNLENFTPVVFPRDLKRLLWRESSIRIERIPNLLIAGAENLQYWDFSSNRILSMHGIILGLQNLKTFILSNNGCHSISKNFFDTMPSLEKLDISKNNISSSVHEELFGKLINLKELDISDTHIKHFPPNIFKNLSNLEQLRIVNNNLEDDDVDFKFHMDVCLQLLDLSRNKLKELPSALMRYFNDEGSDCPNQTTVIDMSRNPVECTCDTLDFLKWSRDTQEVTVLFHEQDRCNMKGHERLQLSNPQVVLEIIERLEQECKDFTWLIIVCVIVATCLVTVVVCKIVYRYRWKIRYNYYNRNRRHAAEGYQRLFKNDAFTSYASSMCSFIKNQLVPVLEGTHNMKVWSADRDSLPGASKAENINHGINNSRKALLLIDEAYVKDSWCDYEMNMARMESVESNRPVIIFVLFDNVSLSDLPASIFRTCQDEQVLTFPEGDSPEEIDDFWKELVTAIQS